MLVSCILAADTQAQYAEMAYVLVVAAAAAPVSKVNMLERTGYGQAYSCSVLSQGTMVKGALMSIPLHDQAL